MAEEIFGALLFPTTIAMYGQILDPVIQLFQHPAFPPPATSCAKPRTMGHGVGETGEGEQIVLHHGSVISDTIRLWTCGWRCSGKAPLLLHLVNKGLEGLIGVCLPTIIQVLQLEPLSRQPLLLHDPRLRALPARRW